MKRYFADTCHWFALANPKDQHHEAAKQAHKTLQPFRTITTEEVLVEFLNLMATRKESPELRTAAVKIVQAIFQDPNIDIRPQTRDSFKAGLSLFQQRSDKTYSMTDCISMQCMKSEGISEVLSADKHFEQEGFTNLY
jgi:predicted nucleic acid-binding protein